MVFFYEIKIYKLIHIKFIIYRIHCIIIDARRDIGAVRCGKQEADDSIEQYRGALSQSMMNDPFLPGTSQLVNQVGGTNEGAQLIN